MKNNNLPMVLSVTSGKGGVGKTSISVNLAYCLSKLNKKVLLLDADLGLANVDVMIGIAPKFNLFHLFNQNEPLQNIIVSTKYGFDILPAASGVSEMLSLNTGQKLGLLEAMDYLEESIDYLIVDTGAGINDNVIYFNLAVQQRLLVITPEPTSLTDAYAVIKILKTRHDINRFKVVVNWARTHQEARNIFKKLYSACDHFLSGVALELSGVIPFDQKVKQGVTMQIPFCHYSENAPASRALMNLSNTAITWEPDKNLDGNIKFFWKKLLFQE